MKITEEVPVEVTVFRSPIDGRLVVQVDTSDDDTAIRVLLNDAPLYDGKPEEDENAYALLEGLRDVADDHSWVEPGANVRYLRGEIRRAWAQIVAAAERGNS
jgi:hypothetical protein